MKDVFEIVAFGLSCLLTYFISNYVVSKTGFNANLIYALLFFFSFIILTLSVFAILMFTAFHAKYNDLSINLKMFGIALMITFSMYAYVYLKNTDIISIALVKASATRSISINNNSGPMDYDAYSVMQKQNNQTMMQNANINGIVCVVIFIAYIGLCINQDGGLVDEVIKLFGLKKV